MGDLNMKKKLIKSAMPIYGTAALWVLLGLICPRMLLKTWFLIMAAVLSVGVYFVLTKVFPGREVEVREAANSGNREIDRMIEEGRKQLDNLRSINAAIPDAAITGRLDRMVAAGEQIFKVLERDTSKATSVRKFMNYYLPTADKLMSTYRTLTEDRVKGAEIGHAMQSLENSLEMIACAFEKQCDNLYKNRAVDIETDIDVLETMMSGDGLIGKGNMEKTTPDVPIQLNLRSDGTTEE